MMAKMTLGTLLCIWLWPATCLGNSNRLPGWAEGGHGQEKSEGQDVYRLQPGDVIEIKFFYNPELNEKLEVGPDGRISLALIHEIEAGGRTREELRAAIQQGYARVLKVPEVTVIIRGFVGQRIFVGGEVNAPGLFPLEGRASILEAIMRAGGFTSRARRSEVILIRKGPEERPVFSRWNAERLLGQKSEEKLVFLQPYDVIFVPKSKIANINVFIDQYIRGVIPIHLVVGFSFLSNAILP